ncbi:MAG: C40 family peptidase [Acidimicrobiia bacterium]
MSSVVVDAAKIVTAAGAMHAYAPVAAKAANATDATYQAVSNSPAFARAAALGIRLDRVPIEDDPVGKFRAAVGMCEDGAGVANAFLGTMEVSDRRAALYLAAAGASEMLARMHLPAPPTPLAVSIGAPDVNDMLNRALAQSGKQYILGVSTDDNDPDPPAFDCAELVRWAAHQSGVDLQGDWSWTGSQYEQLRSQGSLISVDDALRTPGALLYRDPGSTHGHVAISLGDGRVVEARGKDYGVGVWSATEGRRWTAGALVPGLTY